MIRRTHTALGYLFAATLLVTAIALANAGYVSRVAPLIAFTTGVTALLFSRTPAVVLVLVYLAIMVLVQFIPGYGDELTMNENLTQIFTFGIINLGIAWTASRLRETLQAARQSESNHRLIAENTADLIVAYDMDKQLIYANPAVNRLLGYSVAEMQRRDFNSWTHPEDHERMAAMREKVFAGSSFSDVEYRVVTKAGEDRWFAGTWGPLKNEKGKQIGVQALERDVTDRHRLAEELREARDQALEAAKAKSFFLATMSHEIRTPMNGVLGMTNLLLETELASEQRDMAQTVLRSGQSLLAIINDILDFSKIEAGRLELVNEDFEPSRHIEDVCELLAEPAARKGLELTCRIAPEIPFKLRGDGGRLRQVLINLLGNAVKFTERGEIGVECRVRRQDEGRVSILFEVNDSGVGVAPEVQSKLFQPFTQADMASNRRYGGSGLGLAISKELVRKMGGEIGLRSQPGRGSTFWFHLPFEPVTADARPVYPKFEESVLVADDHGPTRQVLCEILREFGARPFEAASTAEALTRIATERCKVALVDVKLGNASGIDLARKLPEQAGVVLLTTRADTIRRDPSLPVQIRGFLNKPVRRDALRKELAQAIGHIELQKAPFSPRAALAKAAQNRRPYRVLIAEDNPVNQRVAVRLVEKLGYTVETATNGLQALAALERAAFDVILMDCQMPELDGFETTHRIRSKEGSLKHTPIVAMTANAMAGDRERCLEAGMDDYVSKPIQFDTLAAALARWTERVEQVEQAVG
ncbi:MAG: response regulator [Bryobacteraceae bacterium]